MLTVTQNKQHIQTNHICNRFECGDKILGSENNLLHVAWQQDVIERLEYEKDKPHISGIYEHLIYEHLIYEHLIYINSYICL